MLLAYTIKGAFALTSQVPLPSTIPVTHYPLYHIDNQFNIPLANLDWVTTPFTKFLAGEVG